jgi:CRISPR type IV-associated protein Csf3
VTPLRVTFQLATAVIEGDYPIHLDDLLAWATVDEQLLSTGAERFSDERFEALIADLPLGRLSGGEGDSVWAASQLMLAPADGRGMRMTVRRTNVDSLVDLIGSGAVIRRGDQINLSSGPDKNYLMQTPYLLTSNATAWCIGDKQEIERLLPRVLYLGKKRSQGFGRIASFSVEDDEEATEKVWIRHLPWARDGFCQARVAVRPPYWSPQNEQDAWVPM